MATSYQQKTYICTTDAVNSGLCSYEDIGRFIFSPEDPNDHTVVTQTSFWTASVALNETGTAEIIPPSFWEDPKGNPTPPPEDNTSPWLARRATPRDNVPLNPISLGVLAYTSPIQYQLRKTGYYCVGKSFSLKHDGSCVIYFPCSCCTCHSDDSCRPQSSN